MHQRTHVDVKTDAITLRGIPEPGGANFGLCAIAVVLLFIFFAGYPSLHTAIVHKLTGIPIEQLQERDDSDA